MAEKKPYQVGQTWDVEPGSVVVLPNGTAVSTRGKVHLDHPGKYVCGDKSITVGKESERK